mgnify:CR=1 FL=1
MTEIDASLRRLGMDYIDLYQIHRWDKTTPIEETLESVTRRDKSGKGSLHRCVVDVCLAILKALYKADSHGWSRFVSMQNHYNLINREEEREMLPLCASEGMGVIPWSPLARGRLTRDWDGNDKPN